MAAAKRPAAADALEAPRAAVRAKAALVTQPRPKLAAAADAEARSCLVAKPTQEPKPMPLLVPEVTIAVFINNHGDRDKDGRSLPEIVWVKGIDLDQMTVDDLGDGLKEVLLASGLDVLDVLLWMVSSYGGMVPSGPAFIKSSIPMPKAAYLWEYDMLNTTKNKASRVIVALVDLKYPEDEIQNSSAPLNIYTSGAFAASSSGSSKGTSKGKSKEKEHVVDEQQEGQVTHVCDPQGNGEDKSSSDTD